MQVKVVHIAFSILKNCLLRRVSVAVVPKSCFLVRIFGELYKFNLISGFKVLDGEILVFLKYFNGIPLIKSLRVVYSTTKPIYVSSGRLISLRGRYNFCSVMFYTSSVGFFDDS
jgi:ribosomal protein S8